MNPRSINQIFRILLLTLLSVSFVATQEETLQKAILETEKFIADFNVTYNLPALVVGVSHKGKLLWQKAYGSLELENYVPTPLDTRFRLASISKTFTSGILGQLVDQGLVSYDDLLSKHLPESVYPAKKWNITIRQLMSHTAGTHVTEDADFFPLHLATNVTDSIQAFKNEPLLFEPGSRFSYSNYGIQIVGAVIEQVTGKTYQEVAREFLAKLSLNSTFVETLGAIVPNRPRYYTMSDLNHTRTNIPSDFYDQMVSAEGAWPAGGYVSTLSDLLHWGQLMIDSSKGRPSGFLKPETVNHQMWAPQTLKVHIPVEDAKYGLGWAITRRNLTRHPEVRHPNYVWHSGGLNGVTTMLFVYPEEEIVGVALTNKGGGVRLDSVAEFLVNKIVP